MFFSRKSKMAARGHSKIVIYEEVNIYSFVIPLFQLIFHGDTFQVFFLNFTASFVFCLRKNPKWPPDTILKL